LSTNVYERSEYTVTSTGMINPSSFAVFALKFLQKSMMFTPCGPSAVPTGGAGVALPAAIWSFTTACTFLAMMACLSFFYFVVVPHPHDLYLAAFAARQFFRRSFAPHPSI